VRLSSSHLRSSRLAFLFPCCFVLLFASGVHLHIPTAKSAVEPTVVSLQLYLVRP
jgi:hypothetical protein